MSNLLRCLVSPHLFLIAATFFFFALDVAAAPVLNATSIAQHLGDPSLGLSNGTKVFLKTTPGFANETARYTSHDAPDYIAAVQPALESDVQKIVRQTPRPKLSLPPSMLLVKERNLPTYVGSLTR